MKPYSLANEAVFISNGIFLTGKTDRLTKDKAVFLNSMCINNGYLQVTK